MNGKRRPVHRMLTLHNIALVVDQDQVRSPD
jgi:hypothetical protein